MLWNEAISALSRSSAHFSAYLVEVAEKKTDSCHASSKTQTENENGEREREMLYFHSRCKLENYSKLSTRKLKNPCVW